MIYKEIEVLQYEDRFFYSIYCSPPCYLFQKLFIKFYCFLTKRTSPYLTHFDMPSKRYIINEFGLNQSSYS